MEEEFTGMEPLEETVESVEDHVEPEPEKPEPEKYSDKVQKRIDKLTWERKSAQEELAQVRAENEALNKKVFEFDTATKSAKVDDIKAKMKAALDDGDLSGMVDLQDELAMARAEMASKRHELPAQPVQKQAPDVHPSAAAWLERNPWYNEKPRARKIAVEMESDLLENGFEMGDELYTELDKKMENLGYRTKSKELDQVPEDEPLPPRRNQAPVASQSRGNEGSQSPSNSRITQADLVMMRKYNFNPNNPTDRKAWLDRNNPL